MKILSKYILKSFLIPFLATFFVILFVLVMQALWLQFDKIAGKGIDILLILELLMYLAQMMVPQALPIAILLSSIMALGNLSENYEFAAVKSAGVSLIRFIKPLVLLMIVLSGLNFLFLNYAFPRAAFKFKNLLIEMQKTKPALALVPGTFNTEIPGYSIKFEEKYGEDDNLLKDVHIYYDLDKVGANTKVIKAANGIITTEKGSKYMTLILKNGYHYEDLKLKGGFKEEAKMPFTKSYFKEYTVNIDISKLSEMNTVEYKQDREMLSVNQLEYYTDSLKVPYDEFVYNKAKDLYVRSRIKNMFTTNDSLFVKESNPDVLLNFDEPNKLYVLENALNLAENTTKEIENYINPFKNRQKILNVYNTEYHRRLAFSISCLVLFFIGIPLGSIIRKGGFGLPMILAISIFVVYFFISTMGKNMAHSSSISAAFGGWLGTLIMLPFVILLMRRATKDKGIFNIDVFLQPITQFFRKIFKVKKLRQTK